MSPRHVIVDGSNLATEGRNMPSLAQLDQAVREFIGENPEDEVTVVVDASFGHRIDPSEVAAFEAAEEAGEVISPPAGAIGRGDAFLLRIAEKTGATVLSNDSFQEFHGEHTWLFDKGRLVGGKPVPGVGWIFMDRTPVRGAKSREVVKEAKRRKRVETGVPSAVPAKAESKAEAKAEAKGELKPDSKGRGRPKAVDRAIARATEEVVEPKAGSKSRRRRGGAPPAEPVNEPLTFITFIAAHPLGSEVVGTVIEYSSHGAFVEADGARCYIPLSAMGDPPPRRAREVVARSENHQFVVQAFDPQRRGIELALPGFAQIAGQPTAETVEAEIHEEAPRRARSGRAGGRRPATARDGVAVEPAGGPVTDAFTPEEGTEAAGAETAARAQEAASPAVTRAGRPRKAAKAAEAPAAPTEAPVEAAAGRGGRSTRAEEAPAKAGAEAAVSKAAAKKAPGKRAAETAAAPPVKKTSAKKVVEATKRAPAKKAPAKKTAETTADKVPARKVPAKKAPAKETAKAPAKKAAKAVTGTATGTVKATKATAKATKATAAAKATKATKATAAAAKTKATAAAKATKAPATRATTARVARGPAAPD